MAVAYDSTTFAHSPGYNNSHTLSHTASGSDRLAVAIVFSRNMGDVTDVTYNGVSMTQQAESNGASTTRGVRIYTLVNPPTGASDVVLSLGAFRRFSFGCITFTGIDQASPIDATAEATPAYGTAATTSITTIANNSMVVDAMQTQNDRDIFADRIGNTLVEANTGQLSNNILGQVAPTTGDGFIKSITAYLNPTGTRNVRFALYNASTDALIGQTQEISISGGADWHTADFATPVHVPASTNVYILGWADGSFGCTIARASASGAGRFKGLTYTTNFPDPSDTTNSNFRYSIYATYDNRVERINDSHPASDQGTAGASHKILATAGATTMSWTWTSGDNWAAAAVSLKEAGAGDDHTIVTQDVSISTSTDNATISQNHVVPTQDITISSSLDASTISQNHVIATQDITISSSLDNATITQNHIVAGSDLAISTSLDTATLNQNHAISGNDISISASVANSTIIIGTIIIQPQHIRTSVSLDNTTINQHHIIATQSISIHNLIDSATINQNYTISVNELSISTAIDSITLTQTHILLLDDVFINTLIDSTSLSDLGIPIYKKTNITIRQQSTSVTATQQATSFTVIQEEPMALSVIRNSNSLIVVEQENNVTNETT